MHVETLAYMFHQLPTDRKFGATSLRNVTTGPITHQMVKIPAGDATLGLPRDGDSFGWDNEFEAHASKCQLSRSIATWSRTVSFSNSWKAAATRRDLSGVITIGIGKSSKDFAPGVLDESGKRLALPDDVRGHRSATRLAGLCEPCGSVRVCDLGRQDAAHRSAVAPRGYGTTDGSERPYPWGSNAQLRLR